MPVGYPDLAATRAYVRVPATAVTDDELSRMMNTAITDQQARCTWPGQPEGEVPEAAAQAYLRRVQREIAARNLPLGMVGVESAEYGPTRLPFFDALVEEHERQYRRQVLA